MERMGTPCWPIRVRLLCNVTSAAVVFSTSTLNVMPKLTSSNCAFIRERPSAFACLTTKRCVSHCLGRWL